MSDGAFPDRLIQLRNRWEADPSSRVFLQLAEEYRHQGRVKEALDVLDRGLKEHPGYLSALVAKGRCHLELGEPELARTVLERVVKQDATQMVANKLLVRAYLDTGEPDPARERLDLYSLLNDSDPEIEELRRRLQAMEQPPQAPQTPQPPQPPQTTRPAPGGDVFDLDPPAPRRASADVFELETPLAPPSRAAAAARPDDPFADLLAPAAPASATAVAEAAVEAPPAEPAEEPEPSEPDDVLFPGLASRDSRRRYLDNLGAEGIFLLDLTPAAAPEAPPPPPAYEPEPFPAWEPEPVPAPAEEEPTEVWEQAAPTSPAPPLEPAEPVPAEEAPVFGFEEPAPEEPAMPSAGPAATATLGEIYLSQGHLGEAERIFREVLRHEPESAEAREGLQRLAARRAEKRLVEARDLLAGYEPGEEGGAVEVRARKAWILNEYLKRLRGGQRDVS
ncbi:MAG TPA: tetratricopeptide repeat protein [Thermoanaerobaculia bacterium]|jgi:tetratricopeptide (TPR) repeat protein|nr:tetratricopeptide repeat protein [Thermoanaerobaculia bacterium]